MITNFIENVKGDRTTSRCARSAAGATRKKVKREPRIKPEVMKKPEVRERVQRLIRSTYVRLPPETHGHAKPWGVMKAMVLDVLTEGRVETD